MKKKRNANLNNIDYNYIPTRMAKIKRLTRLSVNEKMVLLGTAVENVKLNWKQFGNFFLSCPLVVMVFKLSTSCLVGRCSTFEPHSQSNDMFCLGCFCFVSFCFVFVFGGTWVFTQGLKCSTT
jgi:hypothetical protein